MSDEPEETSYYLRLLSMYMDLGTEIVLDVFVYHTPGHDAETFIQSKQGDITQLKRRRVLNRQECDLLFQQGEEDVLKSPLDIQGFDISLLITLSRKLFTVNELAPPKKGWDNPPINSDTSVAADLLRLKKTRNVIVGHHPRARLPFWRFVDEWKNVSEILIRLQQQIAPENEVHLQARIEAYRLQLLDPIVMNTYNAKLTQWHNEVTTMQDQVEELINKVRGFEAYFNSKSDRFERYTKLLFKGGHFVLSAFLDKKIKDDDRDLHKMLMDNGDNIREVISDKEQLDKLYPCNPPGPTSPIDTSSWDVSLLSTVILQLFTSHEDTRYMLKIKKIGEAYMNYANATLLALDSNAFESYWMDLITSINIVSLRLDDSKTEICDQILEECTKKIDEQEFKTYMEELKTQGTQIKSFTETFKDVLKKTKDCLQEMITDGTSFKNPQVLELKMVTLGSDDQKKELAEEILMGVWNEALDRAIQSTDFLEVKKEVTQILEEIKKSKSVKNLSIRKKCILLQMTCASPRDMLDVIYYFESEQFHERLKNISTELGYILDTAIDVYSVLPIECLWRIYNPTCISVPDEERGISLSITVSSPAGMRHLASVFRNDKIANCTNSIADALSKHLRDKIEVKTVADFKEFTHILETGPILVNKKKEEIKHKKKRKRLIAGSSQKHILRTSKCLNKQEQYPSDELRGTKWTLHDTLPMLDFKKHKITLEEEENRDICNYSLEHAQEGRENIETEDITEMNEDLELNTDKEGERTRKQNIKYLYNPETSPSIDNAQAGSSQELILKISKMTLEEENRGTGSYILEPSEVGCEKMKTEDITFKEMEEDLKLNTDKEDERTQKQDIKYLYNPETRPSIDNAQAVSSQEPILKTSKMTLEEENIRIGSYSLEPSEEKYDLEAEKKQRQGIKHLYNPETSPSKDIAQAGSSQEYIIKTTIATDSEETFETIALLELYMSQVAVAEYLDKAYFFLQYSNFYITNEIISTSKVAKEAHEAVFRNKTFSVHLFDLMQEIERFTTSGDLSEALHFAKQLRDETEESKKRYITLYHGVQKNMQQVEKFICSEKESGEDKHTSKEKKGKLCKDESSSKYDIVRSQHIIIPEVTGIHHYIDVKEEKLHKTSKGLLDIDLMDIDAKKKRVEETILHLYRPGLAFTGGIDSFKFFFCYGLFKLTRQAAVYQEDLQNEADRIKEHYEDTKTHALIDNIVIQRRKELGRMKTIRKQVSEKKQGLEYLKEVTRHVENIDTQLTRMMNYWSELTDNIEFLLKNEKMVRDIHPVFPKDNTPRQEWEFVNNLFREHQHENHLDAEQLYRFVQTAEKKKEYKRRHQLILYEKETTQRRSEYKRSELKSPMSEKAEKTSYLKSAIRDTGKHEHIKKDDQQTSTYEHW